MAENSNTEKLRAQDTFSFALVLLCLAVGEIDYIKVQSAKRPPNTNFSDGWRPPIPISLQSASPKIVSLIESMWANDFRARPAMKDVVGWLKTCDSVAQEWSDANDIVHTIRETPLATMNITRSDWLAMKTELRDNKTRIKELEARNANLKTLCSERNCDF